MTVLTVLAVLIAVFLAIASSVSMKLIHPNYPCILLSKALGIFTVLLVLCVPSDAAEAVKQGSMKKGFCVAARKHNDWQQKLKLINAKWFYSWWSNKPVGVPDGIEFVPMMWGKFDTPDNKRLAEIAELGKQGEIKYLMGFNEPDQHEQSNMSVSKAIELWPHLEATGLPLCSPGCVHPDRQWMINFMEKIDEKGYRVDYVCIHSYGGPNAKALIQRLREVHKLYNRPIWITEFAVGDWQAKTPEENKHSPEKIAKFMKELLPKLERLDFVHRYAWFSAKQGNPALGTSALFNDDGTLTELGKIYSAF